MREYVTKSGDMFDLIAYQQMGSGEHTEKLINANRQYIKTFIFSAGVRLVIPDVEKKKISGLPPWRKQ